MTKSRKAKAKAETEIAAEPLLELDRKTGDLVRPWGKTPPVRAIKWFGQVGDQMQMRVLSGAVVALGLARRDPRMVAAGARMLASHEAATLAKKAVKNRVDRWRPRTAADKSSRPRKGHSKAKALNSFPSGHSAGAMAAAHAAATIYPEHRGPILAAGASVGLAQIPTGAHYPTDVATGLTIGALSDKALGSLARLARAALVLALASRLRR